MELSKKTFFKLLKLVLIAALLALAACGNAATPVSAPQDSPAPADTAALTPTPPVTPTPLETPTPSATATATPFPTPDAAQLLAAADGGRARIQARIGADELLCLRYEDLDADGAAEWLALAHQPAEPARSSAYVFDGDAAYALEAAYPKPGVADVGLGEYPTCEIEIDDINADGVPDIAIFGYARENETLLHLYSWDGSDYRRLGFFSGDAGIHLVDEDGDLEMEVWEGYREQKAPSLAWYVIHTWEDLTYGWTSDRYDWYYLNRPQTYPTHAPEYAVVAYYLALNDRDLPGAYNLLAPAYRPGYEDWALGYATTARISVGDSHVIPVSVAEGSARVSAMVTAWDNQSGVIVGRLWNTEWDTVRSGETWLLTTASATLLEEWTVAYWP